MENYEQDMANMHASRERRLDREAIQATIGEVLTERDDREHRALVMVLRALKATETTVHDYPVEPQVNEALTIAGFMWPEAYAEATRDEGGGG